MVRAKFRCVSETRYAGTQVKYEFMPQYDTSTPEDQRYSKYTPSGELRISVDNPAVKFEVGKDYYLDMTLVGA